MNERIRELYQHAHEPQPPTRGTGTLTKDILWGQPDKFNPEKFAELIVKDTMQVVANQLPSNQYLDVAHAVIEHYKDSDAT